MKTIGKIIIRADNDLKWNSKLLKCEAYAENKTLSNIFDIKPIVVNYCKIFKIFVLKRLRLPFYFL